MKVLQILQRKGNDKIESVPVAARISEVVSRLSEKKIGCLLVVKNDGSLAGIVSERDIVRVLGQSGSGCLDDDVSTLMTTDIITCTVEDDDNSVLRKMSNGRFRHMPVMRDETLAGLISIGDVVKARIDSLESDNEELENMIRAATA